MSLHISLFSPLPTGVHRGPIQWASPEVGLSGVFLRLPGGYNVPACIQAMSPVLGTHATPHLPTDRPACPD